MSYTFTQKVLFKHCDPAGIVFYPRYFEMINDTVESFFDVVLDYPFENLVLNNGVPTVQITANFKAPSRHGDTLDIVLKCKRLGQSSVDIGLEAVCVEQTRLSADLTLVFVDLSGRPTAWPEKIRKAIEAEILGEAK